MSGHLFARKNDIINIRISDKILTIVILVAIVAASCLFVMGGSDSSDAAPTATGTCGDNLTWEWENRVLTISGTGVMTNYSSSGSPWSPWSSFETEIDSVIIENGVTIIGEDAFSGCTSLASIALPDSLIAINKYAFLGCTSLTSVSIPDSVTSIGGRAFYGCTSLTSVTIPDSVTSIGNGAFMECTYLTSVTLGIGVMSIDTDAFSFCPSLMSITVSVDNANYCSDENGVLFNKNKTRLIRYPAGKTETTYTIPDSVTSIVFDPFDRCPYLTSIIIPNSVTFIGSGGVFFGCTSLNAITVSNDNANYSSDVNGVLFNKIKTKLIHYPAGKTETTYAIPDGVTSIDEYAFSECTSLTSVSIPDSVTSIGGRAFYGCTSLTSVTIPDSVTSIGDLAFSGCTSLASITIPDSVTSIGDLAFSGCTSLFSVSISCTSILELSPHSRDNGNVAFYANYVTILHDYSATYDWSADCSSCTVHIVCANDAQHNHDIENMATESSVKVQPTCIESGITTYSISGTYNGFSYSSTRDVQDISALGHNYIDTIIAPTCTEGGYTTHICSMCQDTNLDTFTNALGHAYSASYLWSVDGKSCTVHIVCANDSQHNHDINAEVNSIVKTQATMGQMGTTSYSVSGVYNEFAYSNTKDVRDIPALEPEIVQKSEEGSTTYANIVTEKQTTMVTGIFNTAKTGNGSVEVSVPDNKTDTFMILKFNPEAVNSIGGNNVTLTATIVKDSIEIIEAEMIIEITLDGATFYNGNATVTVPLTEAVPDGKVVKVYYINGNEKIDMNGKLLDGNVVFETNHFSTYAIVFEDTPSEWFRSPITYIAIGVIVALVLFGGAVFYLRRRT